MPATVGVTNMILTYDYKTVSELDRFKARAEAIRRTLVFGELTHGQTVDALREIKKLPAAVSTELWEKLIVDLPEADYQSLHNAYVQFILNHRWSL
jgi:hypothetical protein